MLPPEYQMLLMHDPRGRHSYSWYWSPSSRDWTDYLVDQIPYDFDPRAQSDSETGLFVVPFGAFIDSYDVGFCFQDIQIGHNREADGFELTWYDQIDATEDLYLFYYEPSTSTHGIYVSVESYLQEQVPSECTTGTDSYGNRVTAPSVDLTVQYGDGMLEENVYQTKAQHAFVYIEDYASDEEIEIFVQYDWIGSPRRDFTVVVYSADGNHVYDEDWQTNMLYTDGQKPSEFDFIVDWFDYVRNSESFSESEPEIMEDDFEQDEESSTESDDEDVDYEGMSMTTVFLGVVVVGVLGIAAYMFLI